MSAAETDYEAIGREVLRLWQRKEQTFSELGRDVDKLMCWGPEAERHAEAKRSIEPAQLEKLAEAARNAYVATETCAAISNFVSSLQWLHGCSPYQNIWPFVIATLSGGNPEGRVG